MNQINLEKYPDLNLDEAWGLVGEACYAYSNIQARHALMLIRANVAEKRLLLNEYFKMLIQHYT